MKRTVLLGLSSRFYMQQADEIQKFKTIFQIKFSCPPPPLSLVHILIIESTFRFTVIEGIRTKSRQTGKYQIVI